MEFLNDDFLLRGKTAQRLFHEVAEELENTEEYDYNEDVAYLQQFGRA